MPIPTPKPAAVPSAARYQPGARRRRVRVIAALPEGTPSRSRRPLVGGSAAARLALLVQPAVELARVDDAHVLAHRRVPDPAQLGAYHLVAADPVGGQADLGGEARHRV